MHLLDTALRENNIVLSKTATQQICQYLALLQSWNRVFNLTSIDDPKDMVNLHIIDSLVVKDFLHGTRMLDVGSGAGLPGIPLAIANPEQEWVLLDKNNKKTRFLTQVVAELGLVNVEVAHTRTEDFHPNEGFDTILSRAFSDLKTFLETTKHLIKPNGIWLALKGQYPKEELAQLPSCYTMQTIRRVAIKGINIERHLVLLSQNNEG